MSSFSKPHREGTVRPGEVKQWVPTSNILPGMELVEGSPMEKDHMHELFLLLEYAGNRNHLTSVGHLTGEAIQKSILTQGSQSQRGCPRYATMGFSLCRSWEDTKGREPFHCLLHPGLGAWVPTLPYLKPWIVPDFRQARFQVLL